MVGVVCEWGLAGISAWASRASAVVIVDVFSFCTAVSVAVDRGAEIIPFPFGDPEAAEAEAKRRGARMAHPKRTLGGQPSLSPASLWAVTPGEKVLLPSPHGSRLSLATGATPTFAGALRNAAATAEAATAAAKDGVVAVIAAGERRPDQTLRPAIEDWLGAGMIIEAIGGYRSAEAELARASYLAAEAGLEALLRDSISGRELAGRGFDRDVEIAIERNVSCAAAVLVNGVYVAA